MHIFISWSGDRSKHVAEALAEWLPFVIQNTKPWVSSHDISAGETWFSTVSDNLEESIFGIICVTPENKDKEWIHYEAGVLRAKLKKRVCPYLIDLKQGELNDPLAQFQSVLANKEGTISLISSISEIMGVQGIDAAIIEPTYRTWWPKLEEKLKNLPKQSKTKNDIQPQREEYDILLEILENTRLQNKSETEQSGQIESLQRLINLQDGIIEKLDSRAKRLGLALSQKSEHNSLAEIGKQAITTGTTDSSKFSNLNVLEKYALQNSIDGES